MLSNVDTIDEPGRPYAEAVHVVSQSTRFIVWDRRGTGLSDPSTQSLSIDQRIDDVQAILDAAGADRAAFFGTSEGGSMSVLFAATHSGRFSRSFCTALRHGIHKSRRTSREGSPLPKSNCGSTRSTTVGEKVRWPICSTARQPTLPDLEKCSASSNAAW